MARPFLWVGVGGGVLTFGGFALFNTAGHPPGDSRLQPLKGTQIQIGVERKAGCLSSVCGLGRGGEGFRASACFVLHQGPKLCAGFRCWFAAQCLVDVAQLVSCGFIFSGCGCLQVHIPYPATSPAATPPPPPGVVQRQRLLELVVASTAQWIQHSEHAKAGHTAEHANHLVAHQQPRDVECASLCTTFVHPFFRQLDDDVFLFLGHQSDPRINC